MISVINKHHTFYIGRGSPLGNSYVIGQHGTRDEVIEKYRIDLLDKIQKKDKVVCEELRKIYTASLQYNVFLQCFCIGFAENCHGLVIKEILESRAKELGKIDKVLNNFN